MSTLKEVEIVAIIQQGTPDWVKNARKEHNRLNVHVNGIDTDKYMSTIESYENAKQYAVRLEYLTTNRHVFEIISRPIDKVFSAKGGAKLYNLNTEAKESKLLKKLSNVRHGKPIRTWIKDIQSNKYYTDPAGLVFFEWKDNDTYPTIKSINAISNYKSNGRILDWVLFEAEDEIKEGKKTGNKLHRIVDDAKDYTIIERDGKFEIDEEKTFTNPFKKVPAIINSEIVNSELTHNESPFEPIVSLADHYLRTGSIKNIVEFLHGYPIFWRYLTDCQPCKGTGYIEGKKCPSCSGTGKNLSKDITDIIQIERPGQGEQKLAPDLAGYVSPDVVGWQEMRKEQEIIKELMELTLWGSKMSKDANNETATAAFLNVQPVNERLNAFSDAFEDMEKKMTDLIGRFYFSDYKGSSISYGRRFLMETPDSIWKKYQDARKEGVSKVMLDYLLIQFMQTEYANDLERLSIFQKSVKIEPFIHKTDEELMRLPVSEEEKKAKLYFNEWFKTLTNEDILTNEIERLQQMFQDYLTNKTIQDGSSNVQ